MQSYIKINKSTNFSHKTYSLHVYKHIAGHLGGEQQLGSQIEHNQIDLIIFLRDPFTPKSHEPDVNNVVCPGSSCLC